MDQVLEVKNISKTFKDICALDNVSMTINKGEIVALIGASGSGKSTLLRTFSGLIDTDKQESEIIVLGQRVQKNGEISRNIRKIRSRVGFIFQKFNLIDRLSVLKNVLVGNVSKMPFWRSLLQIFTKSEKLQAMEALQRVKVAKKAMKKASDLSGGQQQRVAIARAIMQQSEIILADEPIASLDPESSRKVMKILSKLNKKDGTTVIVSLHQVNYALKYCERIIALIDGKIIYDGTSKDISIDMLHEIYGSKFGETGLEEQEEYNTDSSDEHHVDEDQLAKVKAML